MDFRKRGMLTLPALPAAVHTADFVPLEGALGTERKIFKDLLWKIPEKYSKEGFLLQNPVLYGKMN